MHVFLNGFNNSGESCEYVEDNEQPGRARNPSTGENINNVSEVVRKDRKLSIRMAKSS